MRDEVARALATRALEVAQKAKTQRGEKGEKGDAGEIIVQPNKGDQGERGPIGPQGIPGKSITGAKGDKGDKGDVGQKGDKGDQGNTGKDGAKGDRGERGFTGVKGIDGVQGPIGPMPKHEKKGLMLRFEKEPGIWGEWIVMPTSGGGGGGRDDKLTDRQKELIALVDAYNLQSANPGKYLKTNGTTLSWDTLDTSDITGLGTMATQNANAVAITGGTINGTTVGATTPAAGTFTTITGQTEVLATTSNNLFPRSQTFNTFWTSGGANITATDNAVTAPDSTTTAAIILPTTTNGLHRLLNPAGTLTAYSGVTYTVSIYAKANGYRYLFVNAASALGASSVFDLQAGTVSTTSGTATITSAGNSWYRCTVIGTSTSNNAPSVYLQINNTYATGDQSFAGNGTSNIYLWGAQLEIGSSATTYVPTTTAGIWNVPSLSFASTAASRLGLQSDGSLFLQPAGTGALQAQATTSSTVGGNARGANAVDWQTLRNGAGQVASGGNSVIVGGGYNTAAGAYSSVVTGFSNTANATVACVLSGQSNVVVGNYAVIAGGVSNAASGWLNFVGGGFTNSGTANATVTTQSGTMNATTAVTLSGSNASIKVGQYITGTSINSDTYVAAISGTALTLSKVASGSSTSTLSFFTPHGVVVGGGNNQATGSYSFIGGGGDAGTAANRNVASGDWSAVLGGRANTASGIGAVIVGGGMFSASAIGPNTATANSSFVGAGYNNNATGTGSSVLAGNNNTASGSFSSICGGSLSVSNGTNSTVVSGAYATTRGISGNTVFAASNNPIASVNGVQQSAMLVLGRQTTDATATALTSDTNAASGTNQVILPNNSAYFFTGEVVSGVTGGGDTKGWTIEGVIKRGANAAATALVGTPTVTSLYANAGAATWALAVTADTTNGGLKVTFTGQAATTIRTVCQIRTTEMTY